MNKIKLENFKRAFSTHGGGSHRWCDCGKEFYNPNGGWDWDDGELEELEASGAIALEWSVGTIQFNNREYVSDCECWHDIAERAIDFLDTHSREIAEYLTLEKKRKQTIADESPVVRG